MAVKDQVISLLPKLSAAELVEVGMAVRMLGNLDGGPAPSGPSISEDWVLSGIATYLVRKGLLPEKHAMLDLKRRNAYQQYLLKLPALMLFLNKLQADNGLGRRHQVTLSFLCARSLGDMLSDRNYFSVAAMLSQIDKIPEALDLAYPGYARAGMFGFVLKQTDGYLL